MHLTKKQIKQIHWRANEMRMGRCTCFTLMKAVVARKITRATYDQVRRLEIRCPLDQDGSCTKCFDAVAAGGIDMYDAYRWIKTHGQQALPLDVDDLEDARPAAAGDGEEDYWSRDLRGPALPQSKGNKGVREASRRSRQLPLFAA